MELTFTAKHTKSLGLFRELKNYIIMSENGLQDFVSHSLVTVTMNFKLQ